MFQTASISGSSQAGMSHADPDEDEDDDMTYGYDMLPPALTAITAATLELVCRSTADQVHAPC